MPNLIQPTSFLDWTESNTVQPPVSVAPSEQERIAGYVPGQGIPAEILNYQFREIGRWIAFLNERASIIENQNSIYDAFVGPDGTHADLNAVMADPNIANIHNIYIFASLAVNATQIISKDGVNIYMAAEASITKAGSGPSIGLQIDSDRVRIRDGRFSSFSDSGDCAIRINGKNNLIDGCFFNSNDKAIDDQGQGNAFVGNIEEIL